MKIEAAAWFSKLHNFSPCEQMHFAATILSDSHPIRGILFATANYCRFQSISLLEQFGEQSDMILQLHLCSGSKSLFGG